MVLTIVSGVVFESRVFCDGGGMAGWVENENKEEGVEEDEEEDGRRRWGKAVEVMRRVFIDAARLRATRSFSARLSAIDMIYGYDLWCGCG